MYNYFNFDGTQINDLAIVTKIEKPYIPEKSIDTINVSSRDGEIFDGAKYDPVKIPISLAIIGDDEYDYFTRVNALHDILRTKEEVPIKFCDNVTIYGMLNSSFTPEKKNKCTAYADIELICHTPYSYSDNILAYKVDGENIPINLVLTSLNSNSNVYLRVIAPNGNSFDIKPNLIMSDNKTSIYQVNLLDIEKDQLGSYMFTVIVEQENNKTVILKSKYQVYE